MSDSLYFCPDSLDGLTSRFYWLESVEDGPLTCHVARVGEPVVGFLSSYPCVGLEGVFVVFDYDVVGYQLCHGFFFMVDAMFRLA